VVGIVEYEPMAAKAVQEQIRKFIRDLHRKVVGLRTVVRIVEYEPMAAEAVQEQIHQGFEQEGDRFMKGVRIVEYEPMPAQSRPGPNS